MCRMLHRFVECCCRSDDRYSQHKHCQQRYPSDLHVAYIFHYWSPYWSYRSGTRKRVTIMYSADLSSTWSSYGMPADQCGKSLLMSMGPLRQRAVGVD